MVHMSMPEEKFFLLINESSDHYWHEVLERTLTSIGTLQISTGEDANVLEQLDRFDLIIVDATAVENMPLFVARIRSQRPEARIVVATASPTWTRAREAFQSGAIDYIRKSLDREELLGAVQAALNKILPPWP
jgi:DNA-binding NtrC family response regulator